MTMITAGVQEEAERMNIHVFIVPVSEEPGSLHRNLNLLKQVSADGIILAHLEVQPEDILTLCKSQELPMVALKRNFSPFPLPCIDSDRENGMYQATKLLIGLNHRDIAYFSGIRDSDQAEAKLQGVQRALTEANLSLKPEFSRRCLSTTDDGFRVATNLLQFPPEHRPPAILAYNDLVAIGALHAIRSAGLSVPDDMAVVGFDNIPQASHSNPPLTTVAQPQYQKGQLGVQQLMNWLNGEHVVYEGFTLLSCSLVVRESTGPCPSGT
jgi:DNA-binding LacI/PurR family transcriptional regulator